MPSAATRELFNWPEPAQLEHLFKHLRPKTRLCFKRLHWDLSKERCVPRDLLAIVYRTIDALERLKAALMRQRVAYHMYYNAIEVYNRKSKNASDLREVEFKDLKARVLNCIQSVRAERHAAESILEIKASLRHAKMNFKTTIARRLCCLKRMAKAAMEDGHQDLSRICAAILSKEKAGLASRWLITPERIITRLNRTSFIYRVVMNSQPHTLNEHVLNCVKRMKREK